MKKSVRVTRKEDKKVRWRDQQKVRKGPKKWERKFSCSRARWRTMRSQFFFPFPFSFWLDSRLMLTFSPTTSKTTTFRPWWEHRNSLERERLIKTLNKQSQRSCFIVFVIATTQREPHLDEIENDFKTKILNHASHNPQLRPSSQQ